MIFIVEEGLEMGVIVAQDMERNERESWSSSSFPLLSVFLNFDSLTVVNPLLPFLPLPGSYYPPLGSYCGIGKGEVSQTSPIVCINFRWRKCAYK